MSESNIPLYVAILIVGFACFWKLRRARKSRHPFADQDVQVVNTSLESEFATCKLIEKSRKLRVLGFDCEWVGKNKISLLQLSTSDGLCVLYRLCKLGKIPLELQSLLEDREVLKVGVASVEDANIILKDYDVFVQGCVDLRHLVENQDEARGLAKLAANFLGVELEKGIDVRCGDWEADELSPLQCNYAAQDSLAAIRIFFKLTNKKLTSSIACKLKYFLTTPEWKDILGSCEQYMDVKYHIPKTKGMHVKGGVEVKDVRVSGKVPMYQIMKTPLYENCWILAPDGVRLSTCTRKKVDWYVNNNLGEIVSMDPACVRLFFEPSCRGFDERWRYNAQTKVNQCVVCASKESLVRKNVVPLEYRRHFPASMTDHSTHDILLLCVVCHRRSNINDMTLRHRLEKMSFDGKPHTSNTEGQTLWIKKPEVTRLKNAANALLSKHKIPPHRMEQLRLVVMGYFDTLDVTEELLLAASKMEEYEVNKLFKPHGLDVVDKFADGPGLELLQKLWREHFVSTMKPQYLPPLWSIHHSHKHEGQTNRSGYGDNSTLTTK